jgi:hypothetical protein
MKAWQKIIRDKTANDPDLFIEEKLLLAKDISSACVREVSYKTASDFILKYEWLKCMPAICLYQFGLFFGSHLAGCVVFANEYGENLGVWDDYGYDGKIILLARGACAHWAHEHSGSKLIRQSMKLLPEKFKVVTATVDALAGEIGTIYQACGFDYVGVMRDSPQRKAWMVDGRLIGSRSMRRTCGSCEPEAIAKHFPGATVVMQHSKARYFAFRGSRKERKQLRTGIESLLQPYPKREAAPARAREKEG